VKDALGMRGRSKRECQVWTILAPGSFVVSKEFRLHAGPPAIALLVLLYVATSLKGAFTIPDELAEIFSWKLSRFVAARRELVRAGYLEVVRIGSRKWPAVYCWAPYPDTPASAGGGRRRKARKAPRAPAQRKSGYKQRRRRRQGRGRR
jgi:hypothetical protein